MDKDIPIGSLLLYKYSPTWRAKFIRFFRNSKYSHAIIKLGENQYYEVDKYDFNGLGICTFGELEKRKGRHDVFFPYDEINVNKLKELTNWIDKADSINKIRYDSINKIRYDSFGAYLQVLKIFKLSFLRNLTNKLNPSEKFFCSEFVLFCAKYLYDDVFEKKHNVAPDELPNLKYWHYHPYMTF